MSQQWKRRKLLAMRAKAAEKKILELTEEYKATIRENSYLGKKGYTILKSFISEEFNLTWTDLIRPAEQVRSGVDRKV